MNAWKEINKSSIPNRIVLSRLIFLRLLGLIYLIAFISLYGQIQGWWGDEGIFPTHIFLDKLKENLKDKANFLNFPTVLWFAKFFDVNAHIFKVFRLNSGNENMLYFLCLIGIFLSFCIVWNIKLFINSYTYFIWWYCYLNFYIVGQVFIKYEWDMLLIEVGFTSILFAPLSFSKINLITQVENICFYLLRFILFKIMFSTGTNILTSKCPYWLSFNGLNFFFQSQPMLSSLSFTAHNLPESVKRWLIAVGFFIILYWPFGFFLVWRRFNIFAGQLTFIFNVIVTITGNFAFLNILIITLNTWNFDDYFIRGIVHPYILELFQLDTITEMYRSYCLEKKEVDEKEENEYEKEEELREELTKKWENATTEEKVKINNEIKTLLKNRNYDYDDYDELPKLEETLITQTSFVKELFIFTNFLCLLMFVICFFIFPLKQLLPGKWSIGSSEAKDAHGFMSLYMIYIFIYFMVIIFYNLTIKIKNSLMSSFMIFPWDDSKSKDDKTSLLSKCFSILLYVISSAKFLLFLVLFILFFVGSIKNFYTGIGWVLVEPPKEPKKPKEKPKNQKFPDWNFTMPEMPEARSNGILLASSAISDFLFQRLFIFGQYGQIQKEIKSVNGRSELEIDYLTEGSSNWKSFEFPYKLSITHEPKFLYFYQPRLDWQMHYAAEAKDINNEPWWVILLGKILEKNPVIFDWCGYSVKEKDFLYRNSMFEKLKNIIMGIKKSKIQNVPRKIKIDLYNYVFLSKVNEENKFMKRKFMKEFLANIEKYALSMIFQQYGLPKIDENRSIYVSGFQLIPIVDIMIITFWVLLLIKQRNY